MRSVRLEHSGRKVHITWKIRWYFREMKRNGSYLWHGFKTFKSLWQFFCPSPSNSSLEEGQCPEKIELEKEKETMKCQISPAAPKVTSLETSFSFPLSSRTADFRLLNWVILSKLTILFQNNSKLKIVYLKNTIYNLCINYPLTDKQ